MIEVEKRSLIDLKNAGDIKRRLLENGKLIKKFKRLTLINIKNSDFSPNKDTLFDLKVKIVGDTATLSVKQGNWHSDAGRDEFEVNFSKNELEELVNILILQGYKYFLVSFIERTQFEYKDVEITLDENMFMHKLLVEVEKRVEQKNQVLQAEKSIDEVMEEFNLEVLDSKQTIRYIEKMNSIKKLRVDFTKISFKDWLLKWARYLDISK